MIIYGKKSATFLQLKVRHMRLVADGIGIRTWDLGIVNCPLTVNHCSGLSTGEHVDPGNYLKT